MRITNVLQYLEESAARVPDKPAYCSDTEQLTFAQVWAQSRAVGSNLCALGLYGQPVLIFMQRQPKAIAAFFGCLWSGNLYAPVDDAMPAARIRMICDNCRPGAVLCDAKTLRLADEYSLPGVHLLYDESIRTPVDEQALQSVRDRQIDTDPIYIVYTSGSTGVPKGVCACHRSVIDYIEELSEVLQIDGDTVFGEQAPLYFDACLKELYPTLKFGATTRLIPAGLFLFPTRLIEYCNTHAINTICWVASALTLVSSLGTFDYVRPETLRTVAFGSEVFPAKQLAPWREVLPHARFVNLYGPTECTGMSCYYVVDRTFADEERIPVGHAFHNTEILLLNEENKRCGIGEEGEICIRGTAVTCGYWRDSVRTAESYVQNPLNDRYPELLYRTGDIGVMNKRGELEYVGRRDAQIKHMGRRIELGEIEACAMLAPGISVCCCLYDMERGKIELIYSGAGTPETLAAFLKERLPRYMQPARCRRLARLPMTPNGKIDRRGLLEQLKNEERQ